VVTVLTELFNLARLQELLDSFYTVTGVSVAIIDTNGTVLVSSTRPALCSQFYDAFPESANSCRLSRAFLQDEIFDDQPVINLCPHGLLDAAEPIVINGERLGALLIGQVFAEQPDLDFYRREAEHYGFDAAEFLQLLSAVPVISRVQFEKVLRLMSSLTKMFAEQGLARLTAQQSEQNTRHHAERSIKDIRRQKAQLKMYGMDNPGCTELLDTALEEALTLSDSTIGYIYSYDEESRLLTLYARSAFSLQPSASERRPP